MKSFLLSCVLILAPLTLYAGSTSTEIDITVTGSVATFPLAVSNNTLVTASGQPYMILGDSAWGLLALVPCPTGTSACASTSGTNNWTTYLAGRASVGFNTVMVAMICDDYLFGNCHLGTLADGTAPFTGSISGCTPVNSALDCYDVSKPNPAYFNEVKAFINLAATYNMQVMLVPFDTGQCNQGQTNNGSSWSLMINNYNRNNTSLITFGQYLQTQFGSLPNLAWMHGNDFSQIYCTNADDNIFYGMANAIKTAETAGTHHIHTMQYLATINGATGVGSTTMYDPYNNHWTGVINLNMSYVGVVTYPSTYAAYSQQQGFPSIATYLGETGYEGEDGSGNQNAAIDSCSSAALVNSPFCPVRQRHNEYWNVLSGGLAGGLLGNRFVYQVLTGWQTYLTDQGATEYYYLWKFFTAQHFEKLVPDPGSTFLYCGSSGTGCGSKGTIGSDSPTNNPVTNNYVTGAVASDGSFGVVYFPYNTPAGTVAMSQLNSSVTAQWYDPTKDPTLGTSYTTICSPSGRPCNSTTQTFTPSGTHADGTSDWVLLLTAAG